jgi:hypothetical protein
VTISRVSLPYKTDRHTYIYRVVFEPANSGLPDEQFTDNAVVSSVCTSSVLALGHKLFFHLRNMFRSIRVNNL